MTPAERAIIERKHQLVEWAEAVGSAIARKLASEVKFTGDMGPAAVLLLKEYQEACGLTATGRWNHETLTRLAHWHAAPSNRERLIAACAVCAAHAA